MRCIYMLQILHDTEAIRWWIRVAINAAIASGLNFGKERLERSFQGGRKEGCRNQRSGSGMVIFVWKEHESAPLSSHLLLESHIEEKGSSQPGGGSRLS